jgi:hypothetical protein
MSASVVLEPIFILLSFSVAVVVYYAFVRVALRVGPSEPELPNTASGIERPCGSATRSPTGLTHRRWVRGRQPSRSPHRAGDLFERRHR